jgi:hypothetical protein
MVIIDRLTSQVHLVPTTTTVTAKGIAWLFLKEIVRLHGVPDSIASDRDSKFTSIFWRELQRLMGTKLLMSTTFHPQMDGATEWANWSIAQILQSVFRDNQTDWAVKCPMVELVLNSNLSATTGFAPFELNHGYMPRIDLPANTDTTFKGVLQFAQQAWWSLMAAHDAILEHRVDQTFHVNRKHCVSEIYAADDRVYLSTQNLTLPKGRARRLVPWYIGPYCMTEAHNKALMVTLKLLEDLKNQRVSPTFHTNLIRRHITNNDDLFPQQEAKSFYDFGENTDEEWLVDEIITHRRINSKELEVQGGWTLGDMTWEPMSACRDLEALDNYLELRGMSRTHDLPHRQ